MVREEKNKAEGLRDDEWVAICTDAVTLLLTFFVLLYSIATVGAEKTENISNAFTSMMGRQNGDSIVEYNMYNREVPLVGGEAEDNIEGGKSLAEQEKMYENVEEFVNENNLGSSVGIIDNKRGIIIQLRDNILFETSSSDLRKEGKEVFNEINSLMASIDNQILVEGHTDNRPINTSRSPSNWELSADRVVNVVKYFIEVMGQDPPRFGAAGYREYHPVAPNDTHENTAKNRRVDILIVTTEKREE